MTALRYCMSRGKLVGAHERLSQDPCEADYGGCNHIRCRNCGAMVRIGPPDAVRIDSVTPDLTLYPFDDWFAMPFIRRDVGSGWRFYACKCSYWECSYEGWLENEHESPSDPNVPWACDGHPVPKLPVKLGPLTVAEGSDWPSIVQQILDGACPRALSLTDEDSSTWLIWLYHYLDGLPAADRLASAIAERVDDPNVKVLRSVLWFFSRFPAAAGVERLVARAEASPERIFTSVPIRDGSLIAHSLWDVLIGYLAYRGEPHPLDERVVALVRKTILGRAPSPDVVKASLEKKRESFDDEDLQWLAENIVAIDKVGPGRWRAILQLLVNWQRWGRETSHFTAIAGVAIIQSERVPPSEIRTWMKERGTDRDEWVPVLEASLAKRIKAAP